jgi:predicted small secreted protein
LELDWRRSSGEIAPGQKTRGNIMRKLIVLAAAASALLVGCNTVAGAGRDVASIGKAVTSTANDVKK